MDITTGTYEVKITAKGKQFASRLAKLKKIDARQWTGKAWEVTIDDTDSMDAHHLGMLSEWTGVEIAPAVDRGW